MRHEPVVKFFKGGNNGAMATATTACDADEFLRECSRELEVVVTERAGDLWFTFDELLPQICLLWAKLQGYKAETVFERRVLTIGEPMPETSMVCLNPSLNPDVVVDGVKREQELV